MSHEPWAGTTRSRAACHRWSVTLRGMFDAAPHLRPERASLLDLLRSLSPDQWNARDRVPCMDREGDRAPCARRRSLVAVSPARRGHERPAALRGGSSRPHVSSAARRVQRAVGDGRLFSNDLVVELLGMSGRWTADYYGAVDPTELGEPVGFFGASKRAGQSPLWQAIAASTSSGGSTRARSVGPSATRRSLLIFRLPQSRRSCSGFRNPD